MHQQRVLVVEDEPSLLVSYCEALVAAGYVARGVPTGEAALEMTGEFRPDLVLLDLTLAGSLDGYQVLQTLRHERPHVRIVILTARSADDAQLHGLALGADDYVIKRVSREILLARIHAQLRRAGSAPAGVVCYGEVTVDLGRRVIVRDGKEMMLGDLEARLLERLLESSGQFVAFQELLAQVWGQRLPIGTRFMPEDLAPVKSAHYRLCQKLGSTTILQWRNARGLCLAPPDGQVEGVVRTVVVERIGRGYPRAGGTVHAGG